MIFFIQVAGNSMQIFASEVFPTNARASGFGWAAGVGRLATAVHHADDPVDPERLRPDHGVRLPGHRAADRRRRRSRSSARRPSRRASTRSPRRPAEPRLQAQCDGGAGVFGAADFFAGGDTNDTEATFAGYRRGLILSSWRSAAVLGPQPLKGERPMLKMIAAADSGDGDYLVERPRRHRADPRRLRPEFRHQRRRPAGRKPRASAWPPRLP